MEGCYTGYMRILIVSRDPLAPSEQECADSLRAVWQGVDVQAVAVGDFTAASLENVDALVVAGPSESQADVPLEALSALTNAVLDPPLPVLGIGWGFQVVCLAFGDDLEETTERVAAAVRIIPSSKGETLFQGSDPIRVNETRRWALEELPRGWVALASSETGIEVFQHKQRPVYAMQQYPADFTYASDSKLICQNLLGLLRYTKK